MARSWPIPGFRQGRRKLTLACLAHESKVSFLVWPCTRVLALPARCSHWRVAASGWLPLECFTLLSGHTSIHASWRWMDALAASRRTSPIGSGWILPKCEAIVSATWRASRASGAVQSTGLLPCVYRIPPHCPQPVYRCFAMDVRRENIERVGPPPDFRVAEQLNRASPDLGRLSPHPAARVLSHGA